MTAVAEQVSKRTETKRRHTKPCKFYQTGHCPFSAQECDFMHISAEEYPPPPSAYRRKVCRYFVSGSCTQGPWCRYEHTGEVDEQRLNRRANATDEQLGSSPDIVYQKRGTPSALNPIDTRHHAHTPTTPYPLSPVYLSWSPYADPTVHCAGFPPGTDAFQPITSPTDTVNSSDSAHTSPGSPIYVMDDRHLFSPRSLDDHPAYFPGSPTICAPFPVPPGSYFAFHPSRSSGSPTRSSRSRSQSRPPSSRQKAASYKTKPCKFFKPDSACPKGDQCTFIHDPMVTGSSPTSSPASPMFGNAGSSPEINTASTPSSQSSPSQKLQHELPAKPLSVQEENRKKGYFPISWRVIGGGVMMGRTSASQEDITTQKSDGPCEVKDLGPPLTRRKSTQAETLSTAKDEADEAQSGVDQQRLSVDNEEIPHNGKVTPRARSMSVSIPATPTSDRVDATSLFSAESPGVL